ncbi:copper homeostasis protein cutC homolog [Ctenocephalides felis]|uniref:copper homeostasis protein cutC homolog n=1 Tax=Ctenocephalides felis TaxID=7515 RepID=UPI000E6E3B07|nr:copper homeostasis protein cutC homolog [Ctenocephalides felis]
MLEVCVDSIESAIAASEGGAKRIELCAALSEGGLTPTPGLLKIVKHNIKPSVDVYVMLRPRNGNDFVYSDEEINILLEDIKIFKDFKANGFVFGALTPSGLIDETKCQLIVNACKPLSVTFHRAFDVSSNPFSALETIIKLGFVRILTSGMAKNAEDGLDNIKQLVIQAGNRISIMPGCGITTENVRNIFFASCVKEIHASARVKKNLNLSREININFSNSDECTYVTDAKLVQELVNSII